MEDNQEIHFEKIFFIFNKDKLIKEYLDEGKKIHASMIWSQSKVQSIIVTSLNFHRLYSRMLYIFLIPAQNICTFLQISDIF